MIELRYRQARRTDIPAMAAIRAADWGTEEYWKVRIFRYLTYQLHPKEALQPRIFYVCVERGTVVGLIAGHLTHRLGCAGELEWISIRPEYRGRGIAARLLRRLSEWFVKHNALRVCVDVEPSNQIAKRFYQRHGAAELKPHWMIWEDIRRGIEGQRYPAL